MSKDGVFQLQQVVVSFCKWGGSSKGARELVQYPPYNTFIKTNPHLQVIFSPRHGKHPHVKGVWVNGAEKVICVKNKNPREIVDQLQELRNQLGIKARPLNKRVLSEKPTIQGYWNPYVDLANKSVNVIISRSSST